MIEGARSIIAQEQTSFVVEYHPHLIDNYNRTAEQLLDPFPDARWQRSQLTDDGLRPIRSMADLLKDQRDPNPKLVFEPRGT